MKLHFVVERETKNTYRFNQVDEAGNALPDSHVAEIGTLYVQKSAFKSKPSKITVTVEEA